MGAQSTKYRPLPKKIDTIPFSHNGKVSQVFLWKIVCPDCPATIFYVSLDPPDNCPYNSSHSLGKMKKVTLS